jgi:hypothetical protein
VSAKLNRDERTDPVQFRRYVGIAFAVIVVWVCASVAPVTAAPMSTCATAGITPALVTKVFGAGATIRQSGVPMSSACVIHAGHTVTTVFLGPEPASELAHTLNYAFNNLKDDGPAQKTPISGAGPGADLLTATNYDRVLYPSVLLKAGVYTATIAPTVVGIGQSSAVYSEWEKLARAIHAHDG